MAKNYTTKTASLKATTVDARILDAKKITINGEHVVSNIQDGRGHLANDELDLWNSYVTKDKNGNVIIDRDAKPHLHSIKCNADTDWETVYEGITESQVNTLKTAVKVIDNEVLGANDEHIMYWQTNGLTDSDRLFMYCYTLESFYSDLSSLKNGSNMFNCSGALTSFNSDLSSLTDGYFMFNCCRSLTSFNVDLPSLTDGRQMFAGCSNLTTFDVDLPSLTDGNSMFSACSKLESFSSDLSSLTNGLAMFSGCKLDAQSVSNIIHFIPKRDAKPTNTYGEGNIYIGIGIKDNESEKQLFAIDCHCSSWAELNKEFLRKNWTVTWQFNGV